MGTVRFNLRLDKCNKIGLAPVEIIYQLSGLRKYYATKERIFKENWDVNQQKPIFLDRQTAKKILPHIDYNLLPSSKEVSEISSRLSSIRKQILDIEILFELNQTKYSIQMVLDSLRSKNSSLVKIEAPSNQLFDYIEKYIEENKTTREPGSLSVYRALRNHLQNFQTDKKTKISFDTIDYNFFKEFQNYLIERRQLSNVTVAKQLSTVKTFLNYAKMQGVQVNDKYKDFKIKKENLEVIALSNEEFEKLFTLDLSKNKKLAQVRDVFCFACATGLRYSDIKQLKREHIKKDEIRLTIRKTKEILSIPITPYSNSILIKYARLLNPLPVISNQKTNIYVKELCKFAEIDDAIQIVRFHGSKRVENSYPKYELISVHTGRKTFCTLSLEKGMSAEEVMKISGHKDYQSFKRYVNITEKRSKIVMKKAWGYI